MEVWIFIRLRKAPGIGEMLSRRREREQDRR